MDMILEVILNVYVDMCLSGVGDKENWECS